MKREFEAETINQKWYTDITYIHVQKEGWTYLASVMDLCNRKIIGYAYGTSMTAELAVEAVKNACLNVRGTQGIILHSDLESQYTSQAFESYLSSHGMIHSFGRKRIHSAIGYMTLQQKEDEELKKSAYPFNFFAQSIDIGPLFDTQALEVKRSQLQQEVNVVAELIQQCISENARVALDQTEYQNRYDGLAGRLDDVQKRLDAASQAIMEKQAHREKIEMFLDGLQKQEDFVTVFDEDLWYNLIEYVTVFSKDDVRFTFKDGTEIKV